MNMEIQLALGRLAELLIRHILSQMYLLVANLPSSTSTVTTSGSAFDGSHVYFPASFIVAFETTSFEVRDCVITDNFPALISVPTLLPLKYHTIVFGGSVVLNIQIKSINRNSSLQFKRLSPSDNLVMILHTWSTLHVSLMSSPVVILMSLYPIMLALKTKNMCLYGSASKPYS